MATGNDRDGFALPRSGTSYQIFDDLALHSQTANADKSAAARALKITPRHQSSFLPVCFPRQPTHYQSQHRPSPQAKEPLHLISFAHLNLSRYLSSLLERASLPFTSNPPLMYPRLITGFSFVDMGLGVGSQSLCLRSFYF